MACRKRIKEWVEGPFKYAYFQSPLDYQGPWTILTSFEGWRWRSMELGRRILGIRAYLIELQEQWELRKMTDSFTLSFTSHSQWPLPSCYNNVKNRKKNSNLVLSQSNPRITRMTSALEKVQAWIWHSQCHCFSMFSFEKNIIQLCIVRATFPFITFSICGIRGVQAQQEEPRK